MTGATVSKLNIPESWAETTLGDICSGFQYGANASSISVGRVKLLRITDIEENGKINWGSVPFTNLSFEDSKKYLLNNGDIVIARSGSIGKISIIANLSDKAIFASYLIRVSLNLNAVKMPIFKFYFTAPIFQEHIKSGAKGAAQTNINTETLKTAPVVIPPIGEQNRIVEKIESTQSKINVIEDNVTKAEALIEKYRESLLQKAFRGELVPQNPNDEPASELLKRIRAEKEKQADGKKKKKDELPPIKEDEIPFEIPKSWEWIRLGELADKVVYGSSTKTNDDAKGIPVLRMGNIQNGAIVYENLKYLPKNHNEFPELLLNENDLLFNRTNSPELVGKTAVFKKKQEKFSFASYLIKVAFIEQSIEPEFVSLFLNSNTGREWVNSVMVQQVGQANVNGTKLKECVIPLPPIKEQLRILDYFNIKIRKMELSQDLLKKVIVAKQKILNSILSKAFSGELVEQISAEGTGQDLLNQIKVSQPTEQLPIKTKSKKKAKK